MCSCITELLDELVKRDKILCLRSLLLPFCNNTFTKFNNVRVYLSYDTKTTLKSCF